MVQVLTSEEAACTPLWDKSRSDVGSPGFPGGDAECFAVVPFLPACLLQGIGLAMPRAEQFER